MGKATGAGVTPEYWDDACRHLARRDRVMKKLIPQFGEARLAEIILDGRDLDAAGLQARILRELESFSGGQKATDDRTLIILKRN